VCLVDSLNSDIREQFGRAYEQGGYRRTLNRLSKLGVRREQAEDLVQSAWLRGFERLGQLREQTSLLSWVDAIAVNFLRTATRRSRPAEQLPEGEPGGDIGVDLLSIEVSEALGRCSPRQRRLLELIYLEGYTGFEAAQTLGIPMQAFYSQLARARRALRDNMGGLTAT
jgi:RNA polymerase sigma-70 factor (ECF subfamily)